MTHPERKPPNPFHEADTARDTLQQLEWRVEEMEDRIRLLMQSTNLLLAIENDRRGKS